MKRHPKPPRPGYRSGPEKPTSLTSWWLGLSRDQFVVQAAEEWRRMAGSREAGSRLSISESRRNEGVR